MKLLDYFFYVLTHSGMGNPGNAGGRAMQSCGMLSFWLVFFTMGVLSIIGIIHDNPISELVNNPIYFVIYCIIVTVTIQIRYYKLEKYYKIVSWRQGLSKRKVRVLYSLFLFLYWFMWIVSLVAYGAYIKGWWK